MHVSFLTNNQRNILINSCECSKVRGGKYYAHGPQIASKMFLIFLWILDLDFVGL